MPLDLKQTKKEEAPRCNLAELIYIMDISGSMNGMEEAAVSGFNEFLKDQQAAEGDAMLTLVFFDNEYEVKYSRIPIKDVPKMIAADYVPRGSTALYDAIGMSVANTTNLLHDLPMKERPGKIMFSIFTDGGENASKEYEHEKIQQIMKQRQDKQKWQFVFISSDIEAVELAKGAGIAVNMIHQVDNTKQGIKMSAKRMSQSSTQYRSSLNAELDSAAFASYDDSES